MGITNDLVFTTEEVAQKLKTHRNMVDKLRRNGLLHGTRDLHGTFREKALCGGAGNVKFCGKKGVKARAEIRLARDGVKDLRHRFSPLRLFAPSVPSAPSRCPK